MCSLSLPSWLTKNVFKRTFYIAVFTLVAAVFSTSALTYAVITGRTEPQGNLDPAVKEALLEQQGVAAVALAVNAGWLLVAILLIIAVKTISPSLCLPFLFWGALYIPFCMGVIIVSLRRLSLLPESGEHLKSSLYANIAMCVVAPAAYLPLLVVVDAGRREMKLQQSTL